MRLESLRCRLMRYCEQVALSASTEIVLHHCITLASKCYFSSWKAGRFKKWGSRVGAADIRLKNLQQLRGWRAGHPPPCGTNTLGVEGAPRAEPLAAPPAGTKTCRRLLPIVPYRPRTAIRDHRRCILMVLIVLLITPSDSRGHVARNEGRLSARGWPRRFAAIHY